MTVRKLRDDGIASVVGAVVVLAVLGMALVYTNAYYVPKQGVGLEIAASERAEASLVKLASAIAASPDGPVAHEIPLRSPRGPAPLMSGVVLSPVQTEGHLALDPSATYLTVSILVPVPAGGVPAGDPTRVAESGKMRVYVLGNTTSGQPIGTLRVSTGGAYVAPATRVLEGGAVLADTDAGSASVAPPFLTVVNSGGRSAVTWRLPLLAGAGVELSGAETAQVGLVPGPEARAGGGQPVDDVRISLQTPRVDGWQAAIAPLVGGAGTVTTGGVTADSGYVNVTVPNAKLDLYLVRYDVSIAERSG